MSILDKWPGDLLEYAFTAGSPLLIDRFIRGEFGAGLKKGLVDWKAQIDEREGYRVRMWDYVRESGLDMEYGAPLFKIYGDALAKKDYARANRIEEIYTLMYMTFNDEKLGPEDERNQARQRVFQNLARAAAKDTPVEFDAIMESYERQGLRTYLRIAEQMGIDAWGFLERPLTAIAEAIGGEGAVEKVKAYIQNPSRWPIPSHRRTRAWMRLQTRNMRKADAQRKGLRRSRVRKLLVDNLLVLLILGGIIGFILYIGKIWH